MATGIPTLITTLFGNQLFATFLMLSFINSLFLDIHFAIELQLSFYYLNVFL